MRPALLDVNVLLALAWPNHQHHLLAQQWFQVNAANGWATCAVTELAFIRLSSNPAFTENAVTPQQAAALLRQSCAHPAHLNRASIRADDPAIFNSALGHQQVQDAWLVEVARRNTGLVGTFDRMQAHDPAGDIVLLIS